jgi:hypothetical protein
MLMKADLLFWLENNNKALEVLEECMKKMNE